MSACSSRNAGVSTESTAYLTVEAITESKVLCCSLSASLIPLAIAPSRSSLEMVESLNLFFIGDCPISLFRSPLTVEALMMGPMQSGSKFTDRIIKYLTKCAMKDYACIAVEGSSYLLFWLILRYSHEFACISCFHFLTKCVFLYLLWVNTVRYKHVSNIYYKYLQNIERMNELNLLDGSKLIFNSIY